MSRTLLCSLCVSMALWSCGPIPVHQERIVAWRLVEVDVAGGRELVFERAPVRPPKIEIRLSRERASVGEEVTAVIRLPDADRPYRIRVRPGRPGIRILGPDAFRVSGSETVTVRFTCETAGRGGIRVEVLER